MPNTREKLIEVKKALGICYKEGLTGDCKGCTYKGKDSICMDALMEDALAVINHLEEKQATSKWIPVTERLPKEFEDILVCSGGAVEPGWLGCDGVFYSYDKYESDTIYGVTHWMPLPEAPIRRKTI